jgi:predicted nucleotidyltransferase
LYAKELLAISLVGAISRGEETWANGKLVSDIDILLITRRTNPFLERKIAEFWKSLTYDVKADLEIGCVSFKNLKKERDLENYEGKVSGKVIWGNKQIFNHVPIQRSEEIPKWEGIRLLLNRVFEQLKALCGKTNMAYAIAKTYLAIGEAYLIFDGRYRCSYRERLDQIRNKCDLHIVNDFAQKFEECSKFKLNGCTEMNLTFGQAREDLLSAIFFFLSAYTGRNAPIDKNIEMVARHFYRPIHGAYFISRKALQKQIALKALFKEPCFIVWKEAIKLLRKDSIQVEQIANVINDWHIAPQVVIS